MNKRLELIFQPLILRDKGRVQLRIFKLIVVNTLAKQVAS